MTCIVSEMPFRHPPCSGCLLSCSSFLLSMCNARIMIPKHLCIIMHVLTCYASSLARQCFRSGALRTSIAISPVSQ
jgi:hypothetical protein